MPEMPEMPFARNARNALFYNFGAHLNSTFFFLSL